MTDSQSAFEALAGVEAINAEVARKASCPPHLRAAFALIMGAMVASQALTPGGSVSILVACFFGVILLLKTQRERLGFFVNGYRRGRTRWVALSLLVVVEALLFGSIWLKLHGYPWAPLAAGGFTTVLAFGASYVWQWAYQIDLASATR